jgi:hypothetical protein
MTAFSSVGPSIEVTPGPGLVDPAKAAAVERILALNPRADTGFLSQFGAKPLETYLAHLEAAQIPRGPQARWVRPGDSPAIVWREAQD